ncbi:hypothetical protein [Actinoplanes sp. NPDC026619]|uniref:hypothetical protein n=1 Tax=Actinoplanes sp. NPDC026619 TaxID=3155798 RepID=UPI00340EEB54
MTELLELTALVEAPPERVAEILLDVRPGGRSPVVTGGEGDEFVLIDRGSHLTVTVDRQARSVSRQGEWWYRGVTSVEPDPRGSRVVHRVFNVAEKNGWAVRWVARGPLSAAPASFAETVRSLGEQLGVATRMLD